MAVGALVHFVDSLVVDKAKKLLLIYGILPEDTEIGIQTLRMMMLYR